VVEAGVTDPVWMWIPTGKPVAPSGTPVGRNPEQEPPAKAGARVEGSLSIDRERRRISAGGNDTEAMFPVDAQVDRDHHPVDESSERQAQLSERRDRLSAAKRALLEKRLRG
jgi:hypothetical protein